MNEELQSACPTCKWKPLCEHTKHVDGCGANADIPEQEPICPHCGKTFSECDCHTE